MIDRASLSLKLINGKYVVCDWGAHISYTFHFDLRLMGM